MRLILWIILIVSLDAKVIYPLTNAPIDVVIPCAYKDREILELCVESVKKYVQGVRRVIVVSKSPFCESAEWFDESLFPFSKKEIALEIFVGNEEKAIAFLEHPATRIGWILQQFIKLYAPFIIPNISENVLIVDADVIWLQPTQFMTKSGEPIFTSSREYHLPYFDHMKRLLPWLKRMYHDRSGVVHHMLFQRPILQDFFFRVEREHHTELWKALCRCIDERYVYLSAFSEYETYFNFALSQTNQVHVIDRLWANCKLIDVDGYRKRKFYYVACHNVF